ncbi:PREDICTED: LOB domain-containing protein 22 [Erythranthe guttata]|uniref:LOB domain-containing protein 22 n=1 Tax=Erythranthe guttata TaxID=4155 RepID=UPI00064DB81A|nr:PREDICTED: LOB domain-containing protein 22 [Erythranthe guttata]|eukprot:XP_012835116.1 PREDICTED: LOB domain-containing protein 22 [Erythranthe guttata]
MHNNKNTTATTINPTINYTSNNNNTNININISTNNSTSAAAHHQRSHGSTIQACAACKYQRRKCASDCILAPYFPHDRQRQFLNAHRLFGVSNIVKIVRHLDPPAKDHAMRTIIFQSDARAADPVGGCYRIIRDLEQQISIAKAELEIVLHHLALCRAARHHHHHQAAEIPDQAANCGDSIVDGQDKWRVDEYPEEDEVVVIDDLNSWSCMHGNDNGNGNGNDNWNGNGNSHAESTSSSFPYHNNHHHHMSNLSLEECHDMKTILDHLSGDDDDARDDFNFDSHGNIIPRFDSYVYTLICIQFLLLLFFSRTINNGTLTEENAIFDQEEEDGSFSYNIQDQHDLKAAATFFTLTNCDI